MYPNLPRAMSTHLEAVQAIYAAFGRGDVPAILALLSPTVAWEQWADNFAQRAGVPWLAPRSGRAGAAEFFGTLQRFNFLDFRVVGLLAGDHQVAAEVELTIEVKATGVRMHEEEMHLWSFGPDGLVTRFRHYADTAKHIATAEAWTAEPPGPTAAVV